MTLTEFKRFADENNIVPVSKEIYSQMISDSVKYTKIKEVLDKIRAEIAKIATSEQIDEYTLFIRTGEQVKQMALNIIDKYREDEQ